MSACASGQAASSQAAAAASRNTSVPAAAASTGLDGCLRASAGQVLTIPDPGGGRLTLGSLGHGRRVVILSNQSDEDLCSWLPFARRLTRAGYRAVLWDYGGNLPPDELAALVRWVRSHGARRVMLVGASEGAKASLVAAARLGHQVRGVVSLSAESVLRPAILVARSVARVHCPLLLVTAAQDPYGSAQAAPEFMRAAPGRDKHLLSVPGTAHGTALLSGHAAGAVLPAVLAFLRRVLGNRAG